MMGVFYSYYNCVCVCVGEALILRWVHELKDFALIIKRYLEEDGQVIRVVSIHLNMVTSEQVESVSFFTRTGPSPYDPKELFPLGEAEGVEGEESGGGSSAAGGGRSRGGELPPCRSNEGELSSCHVHWQKQIK